MSTTQPTKYESAAETAKRLRLALKNAFPGVKFSVRSRTYSGGASIDVSWTDGPTAKTVDRLADTFSGADFVFCHRENSPELRSRVLPLTRQIHDSHPSGWCPYGGCSRKLGEIQWFVPSSTHPGSVGVAACNPTHAAVMNAYRFDADMTEEA